MNYLGFIGPFALIVILLFAIALPIIALIDILRSDFKGNDKIIWVLLVLFMNLLGTLLYFMIGAKQKIK
ncbi:PLDc N-terminal domain-containing protein [Polaribacter uvawellassae]|uniref:PLDc N-terminal domain-containing protein n=1 Tax=Polaribacter uvawellassae TaxID=3133495 RepID=UPI00321B5E61